MKNQPKKNSSTPVIIIGLVLIVALGGGFLLYRSSTAPKTNTNRNTANTQANKAATPDTRALNAPPGAQPPHMLGSPSATVTVEEFADFQCPTCAKMHPLSKEIISAYGTRIKFIFRHFPLTIHDKSYDAAVATEAAGLQGKFWDMQNQLFMNQSTWSTSSDFRTVLADYAQKIGLDVEKFKNDMAGMSAKTRVDADLQRGRGMGVGSTPTFYINGKSVPFEQMNSTAMRALIDAELQNAQSSNSSSQTAPANSPANTSGTNTNTANK